MSDIWFCCKKTDKVVELSDCLECKEPKNCLSLASYKQGKADERKNTISELIMAIDAGNYCLQEECQLYNSCSAHSCPINDTAESLIKNWLEKILEQEKENEKE